MRSKQAESGNRRGAAGAGRSDPAAARPAMLPRLPATAEVMATGGSYTLDLQGTLPLLKLMNGIGTLKHRPVAWTDYMLPSATARPGA